VEKIVEEYNINVYDVYITIRSRWVSGYVSEDNHGGHPVCRGRTIKIQNTWKFF